ncbi:MAG: CYTH domain-containing protein [bacterium]|nr:CYTH domain-containing protein [bacterium]
MKTVIVKAKVKNKIEFMKNIQAAGHDFGQPIFQNDRIFLPRNRQLNENFPKMIVRTEMVDPKRKPWFQLIQKRHIAAENVDLIHMTPILNYSETAHIVQQLGFELQAEVMRNRQKLQVEDTIFYLDEVEGLGTYIKLEREVKKGDNTETVRQELWDVLRVLGIDEDANEPNTYTSQLVKRNSGR